MDRKFILILCAVLAMGVGIVLVLFVAPHAHEAGAEHSSNSGGAVAAVVASSAAVIAASAARRRKKKDENKPDGGS
jgi:hypothetical protein